MRISIRGGKDVPQFYPANFLTLSTHLDTFCEQISDDRKNHEINKLSKR